MKLSFFKQAMCFVWIFYLKRIVIDALSYRVIEILK